LLFVRFFEFIFNNPGTSRRSSDLVKKIEVSALFLLFLLLLDGGGGGGFTSSGGSSNGGASSESSLYLLHGVERVLSGET